jgi:hypothetical protein
LEDIWIFFVMLYTPDGGYTPMITDDGMAKYETEEKARKAAENSSLGGAIRI